MKNFSKAVDLYCEIINLSMMLDGNPYKDEIIKYGKKRDKAAQKLSHILGEQEPPDKQRNEKMWNKMVCILANYPDLSSIVSDLKSKYASNKITDNRS